MLPRQLRRVIGIWNGIMKYKVLKDYPTTDGVLYEKEIVKVWDAQTTEGNLRVKDNMGRIWNVPKNILKEVSNG
tara:strand:+ start:397 stop:618 length:222 start_codon:yes stop_codon:yes gene_type:complete